MAKAFLRGLPRIPNYALPKDADCPICAQPYENQTTDSGSFEKAVCLPCSDKHIFGSDCLSEWLRRANTCPLCRHGLDFLNEGNRRRQKSESRRFYLEFDVQRSQDWEEYWYTTFWILQLQGDKAIERKWQQWQQDWIAAAEQWDESIEAQTRAALRLAPPRVLGDKRQVKATAVAISTVRFREYRLYFQLQPGEAERPELKASPESQLTPAQEDALFAELERREAFMLSAQFPDISKRDQWNNLRGVGFVYYPDCEMVWRSQRGTWSRHWC